VTSGNRPLEYRIDGPTPIRVLSRLLAGDEVQAAPVRYALRLEIDGVELRVLEYESQVSTTVRLPDDQPIHALEKSIVHIPAGSHKVRIVPAGAGTRVALRVFLGDGTPRSIRWVPYVPDTYERPIRLHGRDSEVVYYRFTAETPVTLHLNGPTRLQIRSRLDFGAQRGYSQTYALKLFVDGRLERTWRLKARASHTSIYPDLPEITPGVSNDVTLEVPAGRHELTIGLDCTTAGSAALRLFIPESAVTNGT
jgi:hypothetical protein